MTLICMRMKLHAELIFIWKVSHLDSFWNRDTRELGNGLLYSRMHWIGKIHVSYTKLSIVFERGGPRIILLESLANRESSWSSWSFSWDNKWTLAEISCYSKMLFNIYHTVVIDEWQIKNWIELNCQRQIAKKSIKWPAMCPLVECSCHIRAKCQQLWRCHSDERRKQICTTSRVSGNRL